jgi:hypothetical protein
MQVPPGPWKSVLSPLRATAGGPAFVAQKTNRPRQRPDRNDLANRVGERATEGPTDTRQIDRRNGVKV